MLHHTKENTYHSLQYCPFCGLKSRGCISGMCYMKCPSAVRCQNISMRSLHDWSYKKYRWNWRWIRWNGFVKVSMPTSWCWNVVQQEVIQKRSWKQIHFRMRSCSTEQFSISVLLMGGWVHKCVSDCDVEKKFNRLICSTMTIILSMKRQIRGLRLAASREGRLST